MPYIFRQISQSKQTIGRASVLVSVSDFEFALVKRFEFYLARENFVAFINVASVVFNVFVNRVSRLLLLRSFSRRLLLSLVTVVGGFSWVKVVLVGVVVFVVVIILMVRIMF